MLRDQSKLRMTELFKGNAEERSRVKSLIAQGRSDEAERDPVRQRAFSIKSGSRLGIPESISGTNDFQPASFLVEGANARRSVCRITVNANGKTDSGTGFLISPGLIMTNQHVIPDSQHALHTEVLFADEVDGKGKSLPQTAFLLDPDKLSLFSDEGELDYAIVAIGSRIQGTGDIEEFGYLPLSEAPNKHAKGFSVNIIQHPRSRKKTIAIRNNYLLDRDDRYLFYDTDTLPGSSGAPVFNDEWQLLALHHYGEGDNENASLSERVSVVNAGIRASAIYKDLRLRLDTMSDGPAKKLLIEALSLYASAGSEVRRLQLRPASAPRQEPSVPVPESSTETTTRQARVAMRNVPDQATLTLPLEISFRIGAVGQTGMGVTTGTKETSHVHAQPIRRRLALTASPERARLDRDYDNRNGFDADFIDELRIDLNAMIEPIRKSTSALLGGTGTRVMAYQNFSSVINVTRRMATLTATNIDGPSYSALTRDGDKKTRSAEGETWYVDPRLNKEDVIGADFYAAWSDLFDRGHLTRRADPTWGDEAAKAETDTFHFTNCSPQHFLFNQGKGMWQGLEMYVLENGVNAVEGARISVLQGPVFNDEVDGWADDVQVPSQYWKLVVWRGAAGLKAVALVADQTNVLGINRGDERPDTGDKDLTKYLVGVPQLEKLTGLNLAIFREIDTIKDEMPTPGEGMRVVTTLEDIPLL